MLNVEKENDEDQRKVAEKEPKDDTIDNISNWYKKNRSGKGNGIRFNARRMKIALSQLTSSLIGHKAFCKSNIAPRPRARQLKYLKNL